MNINFMIAVKIVTFKNIRYPRNFATFTKLEKSKLLKFLTNDLNEIKTIKKLKIISNLSNNEVKIENLWIEFASVSPNESITIFSEGSEQEDVEDE